MMATAPDLRKKREHKSDAAWRESKAALPAMTALANPKDSALRETSGAKKRSGNPEAMRLALEREKSSPSEESTKAPNEN